MDDRHGDLLDDGAFEPMDDRHGDSLDDGAFEPADSKQRDTNRVPRMKAKSQRSGNQRKRKATADRGICARRHRRY